MLNCANTIWAKSTLDPFVNVAEMVPSPLIFRFANVPALNLLMGAPLKVAVGTSGLIISIINSSAAWVYINRGALLPAIAVPCILGVMLGSRIGARLLHVLPAQVVRRTVIVVLALAGARALLRGLGIWA